MSVLWVAVAFVGVLCALDLVLTIGVIKRLREHTEMLSNSMDGRKGSIGLGEKVDDFSTQTTDGEPLSSELLDGQTLVGFFSPNCRPCEEKLPKFVEYARSMPGGRQRVLAAVAGDGERAARFVAELRPVAQVVLEKSDGALNSAFQVQVLPSVLMVAPNADGVPVVVDERVNLDRPAVAV